MTIFYFLMFSYLIILICCSNFALASNHSVPSECTPKSCGSLQNISYPFLLVDQQQSYCGYPSLQIECRSEVPFLKHAYGSYDLKIRDIFYENKSLLLDMQSNYDHSAYPCQIPKHNLSHEAFGKSTPLRISEVNKQLYLFNCSKSHLNPPPEYHSGYEKVADCNDDVIIAYVGDEYKENQKENDVFDHCQVVTMPTILYDSTVDTLLSQDNSFIAEWDYCTQGCEGKCPTGYQNPNSSCVCGNKAEYITNCYSPPERNEGSPSKPKDGPPQRNEGSPSKTKGKGKRFRIILGVLAGFLCVVVATIIICLYKCKSKKRNSQRSSILISQSSSSSNPTSKYAVNLSYSKSNLGAPIFTYEELEEATDGFNASNQLGEGGFGTVYKGNLLDGRTVAIKRLYESNYRRVEQFKNEIQILSKLKHQNLVSLYGCTSHRSRELLLVYEFVPNGTVADHLHGDRAIERSLTWGVRMNIAVETADALHYLHSVKPQIIHRDVKSNNILLDECFHVKVADFGLSRLFPLNATHVSTAPQGTPGYVDPDYYQCYQLNDKSDVYSFGVVLVELISSKPAVDIERPRQNINLSTMAYNMILNNELGQLVDPGLGYDSDYEIKRTIDMVAEIAFKCLQAEREMRPCIKEVVNALRAIQSGERVVVEFDGKEDSHLLRGVRPFSPNSVTGRWESIESTPSNSS